MTDDPGPGSMVCLRDVSRSFQGPAEVLAVRGVSLDIAAGEYVSLVGPSGAGKSTLLNVLGLLDRPTVGTYHLAGVSTTGLSDLARTRLRGSSIGFVFQSFHLLPRQTVLQNVLLGTLYSGVDRAARLDRAVSVLKSLGLAERARFMPGTLSGGERQRVALARALVAEPMLLLADEPTGNLDQATSAGILDVFDLLHEAGQTIVVITHDQRVAERAHRQVNIVDGRLSEGRP